MGANFDKKTGDGAHITLWKSVKKDSPTPTSVYVDGIATERDKKKEKPVNKNWKDMFKSALGLMTEADPAVRTTKAADLLKAAEDLPDDGDQDDIHKADDSMCKCADCMAKRTSKTVAVTEEMVKDAISKAVAAAREPLEKALNVEIEKRESGEITALLKSFASTPFNLETDVPVYLAMKKTSPAAFDRTMAILKATDAQLAAGLLMKDVGTRRGTGEGSAWAQIEAKADMLVSKSAGPMTKEQAIDAVLQDPTNNKLVKQYRAEAQ